jgi:ABC-type multidrug transport system fused ATPase/permease subunit
VKYIQKLGFNIWRRRSLNLGLSYKATIILILLSFITTASEVFGISIFLPIFQFIRLDGDLDALTENMELWDQVIDYFAWFGLNPSLAGLLIVSFSLFLMRQIFSYIRMLYTTRVIEGIVQTQRNNLFSRYLKADSTYHDSLPVGSLVNVILNEVNKAVTGIMAPIELAVHFVIFIGYLSVLFAISVNMTLAALFVFLITSRIPNIWIKRSTLVGRSLVESNSKMSEFMLGRLRSPRLVRLSGTEAAEKDEFFQLTEIQRKNGVHLGILRAKTEFSIEPVLIALSMIFLYFASTVLMLQIELIGLYLVIALRLMPTAKGILTQWQTVQRLLGSIEIIEERLKLMNDAIEIDNGKLELSEIAEEIKFINIDYCYPLRDKNAINNISLNVKIGETTAIVGPSGSGKSTLIDLLPRLRTRSSGELEINGLNIENYSLSSLRNLIAYLPQTPQIFNGTIINHISYGKSNASLNEIKDAAELAGVGEFINNLKDGYDTNLGEEAIKLSGGQRQRLDLARALVRKSSVLILDEPTSNLDAESEDKFNVVMDRIRKETTTTIIIVTHSLRSALTADKIVVLNGGEVEAIGKHNELVIGDSWYASAWKLQKTHEI